MTTADPSSRIIASTGGVTLTLCYCPTKCPSMQGRFLPLGRRRHEVYFSGAVSMYPRWYSGGVRQVCHLHDCAAAPDLNSHCALTRRLTSSQDAKHTSGQWR